MYDMYPDRWTQDNDGSAKAVTERPHRRPRKTHRVEPQVIVELERRRHSEH